MELLPLGPVVIIDTPGIDDEGTLITLLLNKVVALKYINKISAI